MPEQADVPSNVRGSDDHTSFVLGMPVTSSYFSILPAGSDLALGVRGPRGIPPVPTLTPPSFWKHLQDP